MRIDQSLYMVFLSGTGDLFDGCMAARTASEKNWPVPRRSFSKHQIRFLGPTGKFQKLRRPKNPFAPVFDLEAFEWRARHQPGIVDPARRAPNTTVARCAERNRAVASPNPLLASVMTTTLPSMLLLISDLRSETGPSLQLFGVPGPLHRDL